jgi:hypothetical protein
LPKWDHREYDYSIVSRWKQNMTTSDIDEFVRKAEEVYATRLRSVLEPRHVDEFVAIEPESGDYFLGRTLSEAMGAARRSHPDRLAHAMRIGHKAALHFGMHVR